MACTSYLVVRVYHNGTSSVVTPHYGTLEEAENRAAHLVASDGGTKEIVVYEMYPCRRVTLQLHVDPLP